MYKSFCQVRAHVAPPMWRPVMLMMGRHRLLAGVRPKAKSQDGWDWGPLLIDALPPGALEAATNGEVGNAARRDVSSEVEAAHAQTLSAATAHAQAVSASIMPVQAFAGTNSHTQALAGCTTHAACDACADQTDSFSLCAAPAVTDAAAGLSYSRTESPFAECRGMPELPFEGSSGAAETGPTSEALAVTEAHSAESACSASIGAQ
jgi:hypothetical protein